MVSSLVKYFALMPGIVFLGLGLRRVLSKLMQWTKLLIYGESSSSHSRRTSLASLVTGIMTISVGAGWILVFLYFGIGPDI